MGDVRALHHKNEDEEGNEISSVTADFVIWTLTAKDEPSKMMSLLEIDLGYTNIQSNEEVDTLDIIRSSSQKCMSIPSQQSPRKAWFLSSRPLPRQPSTAGGEKNIWVILIQYQKGGMIEHALLQHHRIIIKHHTKGQGKLLQKKKTTELENLKTEPYR